MNDATNPTLICRLRDLLMRLAKLRDVWRREKGSPHAIGIIAGLDIASTECQAASLRTKTFVLEADCTPETWKSVQLYGALKSALRALLRGDRPRALAILQKALSRIEGKR